MKFPNGHLCTPGPSLPGIGRIGMGGCFHASQGVPTWRLFPWYVLVLSIDGAGYYTFADGDEGHLAIGDVLILRPGIQHRFGPRKQHTWSECFLAFDGPLFNPLFGPNSLQPSIKTISVPDWQACAETMLCIMQDTQGAASALTKICTLLGHFIDLSRQHTQQEKSIWLRQVEDQLELQAYQSYSGQALATALNMPYETLRKHYLHMTGISLRSAHQRQRMRIAVQLLSDHSVSTVADILGFCDQFQFSRSFKQVMGVAPSRFYLSDQKPSDL